MGARSLSETVLGCPRSAPERDWAAKDWEEQGTCDSPLPGSLKRQGRISESLGWGLSPTVSPPGLGTGALPGVSQRVSHRGQDQLQCIPLRSRRPGGWGQRVTPPGPAAGTSGARGAQVRGADPGDQGGVAEGSIPWPSLELGWAGRSRGVVCVGRALGRRVPWGGAHISATRAPDAHYRSCAVLSIRAT